MSISELTLEEEELLVDIAHNPRWKVRDKKEYASLVRKGLIQWISSTQEKPPGGLWNPLQYYYVLTPTGKAVYWLIKD